MKLKEDQMRIKDLLKDTITLLCKNGLQYRLGFSVEALIGITLDEEDVFLVNIKESVQSDAAKEGYGVEVSVRKAGEEDESENESDYGKSPKKKSARKRPPDGSPSVSDLPSPAKHSRTEMDDASNTSELSKDSTFNIKAEPEDEDDLVFVKEEGNEFSSCSQSNQNIPFPLGNISSQQASMITTQGYPNPNFPNQTFDTTSAESLPGISSWTSNQNQGNLSGASSFTSPTTQQISSNFTHRCHVCTKRFTRKTTLIDHLRGAHGIGEPLQCSCGATFMGRGALRWHGKTCVAVKDAKEIDNRAKDPSSEEVKEWSNQQFNILSNQQLNISFERESSHWNSQKPDMGPQSWNMNTLNSSTDAASTLSSDGNNQKSMSLT